MLATAGACHPAPPLPRPAAGEDPPTWAGSVAALLHERCAECHRPGGSAPFSLMTYDDAAPRARRLADAVDRRIMPPWLPDPDVGDFLGTRRLDIGEIALLRLWADAGAPAGALEAAPEPPVRTGDWNAGPPDLVVHFPPFTVPADGVDLYQNLVAPIPVSDARWVRSVELLPGDQQRVHHARLLVDTTGSSRDLATRESAQGLEVMHMSPEARDPDGFFLGWTPGRTAVGGRDDLAWRATPGADLVLQMHLRPSGAPVTVRPRVGLRFAAAPPARTPALIVLRSTDLDIPAGDPAFVAEDHYRLPVAVEVLSVYPHAHYLGRTLEAWAVLPDGRRMDLLRIGTWDFDWQDEYRYRTPVRLPAGAVLTMHYTFDNSAANPRNPHDPPRPVAYGLRSTDEMAELIVQVLPGGDAERAALADDLARHEYQAGLDREARAAVRTARGQVAEGRLDEAMASYRRSLLARDDPRVMAELAEVALQQGDAATAVMVARAAVQRSGDADARVLAALARALAAGGGTTDEARQVATRALRLAQRGGDAELADSLSMLLATLPPPADGSGTGPGTPSAPTP